MAEGGGIPIKLEATLRVATALSMAGNNNASDVARHYCVWERHYVPGGDK
jgi:hypothetical protein